MLHFEELVKKGEWDEVEKYLLGFTSHDENRFSKEVFFQIRKQKYLEAIDRWILMHKALCICCVTFVHVLCHLCAFECILTFVSFYSNAGRISRRL